MGEVILSVIFKILVITAFYHSVVKRALFIGSFAIVNAGNNYQVSIALNGEDNYYIATADASRTFVINKKVVSVTWDNLVFDYDGEEHKPTASANDILGQPLDFIYSGEQSEVGIHTVTITCANTNYIVTNDTAQFEIKTANPIAPDQE